jgi:hypothetical protein
MKSRSALPHRTAGLRLALLALLAGWLVMTSAIAQQSAAPVPVGAAPPPEALPRAEFAFEARVTLAPATVLGETGLGHRQYIPITGGKVTGPKFTGEVIPGGWDYQLRAGGGCNTLTADYFWRATDGTVIHILNEGLSCPGGSAGSERSYVRPRFEAPKGPHEWMTRATFVATIELEQSTSPASGGEPPALGAIRIRFYQIK